MSKVEVAIQIAAPPQAVFDTVMDHTRLAEWVTIHRSVRVHGDGRLVPGLRMDQVLHMRGVSFKVEWTLKTLTEPHYAEWNGRGPAGSRALTSYSLSGPDSGPTQFSYLTQFATPGGPLGNAASRLVVGHASEREAHASLRALKAILEH
ncbi:MAG: SRPBCC family protein [Solirubrobacterales bacterium]|nr:SRPBCC family protein [Solirubrobacterales bacterium]